MLILNDNVMTALLKIIRSQQFYADMSRHVRVETASVGSPVSGGAVVVVEQISILYDTVSSLPSPIPTISAYIYLFSDTVSTLPCCFSLCQYPYMYFTTLSPAYLAVSQCLNIHFYSL